MQSGVRRKKMLAVIMTAMLMTTSAAMAQERVTGTVPEAQEQVMLTQTVQLPGTPWAISIPDQMRYDGPRDGDGSCVFAYILPYVETDTENMGAFGSDAAGGSSWGERSLRMEIDFFIYASEGLALADAAQAMTEAGMDAEIRYVNGIEMLCGVSEDPADGAPCISYGMVCGENIVEITFWCADQEAANLTKPIMESIRGI